LFVGGESDFFTGEVFRRFDVENKKFLDFKVKTFLSPSAPSTLAQDWSLPEWILL
jgi:hypothetical protein